MKELMYGMSALSFYIFSIYNFTKNNYLWSLLFFLIGIFYVWRIIEGTKNIKKEKKIYRDIDKEEVAKKLKYTLDIYKRNLRGIKFLSIIGWGFTIFTAFYNLNFSIACLIVSIILTYKLYIYSKAVGLIQKGLRNVNSTVLE